MNVASVLRAAGKAVLTTALSFVALLAVWWLFLKLVGVSSFVGKSPRDVYRYLFTQPGASTNRSDLLRLFGVTMRDAGLGFVVGMTVSVLVAVSFVLSRTVERTFLPVAMAVRSVPVIAMTPVLVLMFGFSARAVLAVVFIVVFFPTLVLVSYGLRSASSEAFDLLAVYDADPVTVFRKVRVPSALPSLFAAARIAGPGSIVGALLGEWLASGKGLGYQLISATTRSRYNELWAAAVLITVTSIAVYEIIGAVERVVLDRYAPEQPR